MARPVSSIRNLGPAMEQAFAAVGIDSAEALEAMGPDAAYGRLLRNGLKPHFIGYYVLVMGLQGRPWNDCKSKEKAALRKRFDALKADNPVAADTRMAAILDEIGIMPAKTRPRTEG